MAAASQSDPIITWMVLIGMLFGGIFGMWVVTYRHTGPALIALKQYELYPLTFVSKDAQQAYTAIQNRRIMKSRAYMLQRGNRYDANTEWTWIGMKEMWREVVYAGIAAGSVFRYPVGIGLLALGFYVLLFSKTGQFKNKHTLESLMKIQAITWPVISPIIKFNPANGPQRAPGSRVPLELPLFSEALYPEEWMAFNRIRVINGVPDRDQIRRALLPQLGDKFDGIDNLPEPYYCLLAAFALKGGRKRKESDDMLGEIAKCWTAEEGFKATSALKSKAARILNDKKLVEPLLEVMSLHAYVTTAFIAVLAWARMQGGVLASAQFVWLRGEDRTLWYPLNNLGRRSFHVEASGAMAHYQAELEARRPLVIPRVDSAVVAIVQYISETRAKIPEIEGGEVRSEKRLASGRADALMLAKPTKH